MKTITALAGATLLAGLPLLSCGDAGDDGEVPPEMGTTESLASGGTRYVGFFGFAFDAPEGWRIAATESGAELRPPSATARQAEYAVALRPVPGVTSSRDRELPATLATYAAGEAATDMTPLPDTAEFASRGGDGVVVSYAPDDPGAGPPSARVYAIVDAQWTLLLRATGPTVALEAARDGLADIAGSLEFVAPRLDAELVGAWYSKEVSDPDTNAAGETFWDETEKWLKLRDDGTARIRAYWKATTNGHTETGLVESNGRWAVYGDRLYRLYDDGTRGMHQYTLSSSGAKRSLVLEPEGDIEEPTQTWREDPDVPF